MRILAAAEDSGSFKEIVCSTGTDTSSQSAPQPESVKVFDGQGIRSHIQKLIVVPSSEGDLVVAARAGGAISFYATNDEYNLLNTVPNVFTEKDHFISLIYAHGVVVAASNEGQIVLVDPESVSGELKSVTTTVKGPLSAFVSHPEQTGVFAFGGKENDVKIVRLYTEKPMAGVKAEQLFQAKNVKNDKLDLRVPVWVTNVVFVNLKTHSPTSWEFITTTGYGQVRKYDTTHGRKPVMDKKISDKPFAQVARTLNESEIICADTHALTALFHVEKGTLLAKYKGSVGAVQGLYSHLTGKTPLLVTGALDRYVRVFDIDSREQVAKVFVGSKVSSVWLLDASPGQLPPSLDADDGQKKRKKKVVRRSQREAEKENPDRVWDELDELETKVKKQKN